MLTFFQVFFAGNFTEAWTRRVVLVRPHQSPHRPNVVLGLALRLPSGARFARTGYGATLTGDFAVNFHFFSKKKKENFTEA
jgi:hypothetical protein